MATKDRKLKSSKQDDKKHGRRADDLTIMVDDIKDSESLASPTKIDGLEASVINQSNDNDVDKIADPAASNDNNRRHSDDVFPSDATKLTEIIILRYEGDLVRGQYDGFGEGWLDGGSNYKGEFSQGMMHGNGLFTWANGQTYEGELRHNAFTGKGVYTWCDGSTYSGDLLNGLRHGIGNFVEKNGRMNYTGEWYLGKRHGKGRMNYDFEKNSYYDGDWVQNIRHGHGTRQYATGNVYTGMWFNNVRHGKGTMKWVDSNQMYIGQWEDGVQHGSGQHVWFVRRIAGSQYSLRNTYDGEFVKSIRHGYGTFYYANGAKYEGYWYDNMKHGQGRFTFKNGRYYEGVFEQDHIKEHPEFNINGDESPDMQGIRTRTPLPVENMSVHSNMSTNTIGPSFQLDLEALLKNTTFDICEDDVKQVNNVIKRHMSALKKMYDFYSSLGYYDSSDNTFILSHMQFWRLLKDCQLHHKSLSLIDMDRLLEFENQQNPHDRILFREFINKLIQLAVHLFRDDFNVDRQVSVNACVNKLISDHILKNGCKVKGYFYHETRRAFHALQHMDSAYQVYLSACKLKKKNPQISAMRMRDFLFMMRDLKLINADLTTRDVVQILTNDSPNATDEQEGYNLEMEITFLEFFEALVGCAQFYVTVAVVKDPSTPQGSTACPTAMDGALVGADQMSMASEPTSARSALPADQEDDYDGKSSLAPLMTPRSTTPANIAQAASAPDRALSSGVAASVSKPKTEYSESADALPTTEMRKSCLNASTIAKDVTQCGISGATMDGHKSIDFDEETPSDVGKDPTDVPFEVGNDSDETRQFNFWTHQIYIFFMMKFFPAYHKYAALRKLVTENSGSDVHKQADHTSNCICRGKTPPPSPPPVAVAMTPNVVSIAPSPETRLSPAAINQNVEL